MRMKRMRNGLELFNKVDGCFYRVVEILNDNEGLALKENQEDDSLVEDSGVVINAGNCLAFRIIADPEPYPVPQGYTVENGILMAPNATPACEQGSIVVESILAALPGILVLNVKPRNEKDEDSDIVLYNVVGDEFKVFDTFPTTPYLVGYVGNKAIIAYSKVRENRDEDGKTTRIFEGSMVTELGEHGYGHGWLPGCPIVIEDIIIAQNTKNTNEYYELYVPCDEMVDDNMIVQKLEKREWARLNRDVRYDDELIQIDGKIKADWSPAYQQFVLHSDESVYVTGRKIYLRSKTAAKVVNHYPILIDITKDGYDLRLTFSNNRYEMKTIVSKSTRDRGYVVTVE